MYIYISIRIKKRKTENNIHHFFTKNKDETN